MCDGYYGDINLYRVVDTEYVVLFAKYLAKLNIYLGLVDKYRIKFLQI
ncbi:MAG: hypothetical protein IKV94_05000 [Clostridia bacterium]|nr:hypothetical protein [Clostridia bacterium]